MNLKEKRYYIYENIEQINNHNQIIDLINQNNCKYTQNNNGIFVNLNTLSETTIHQMYQILFNLINNETSFSLTLEKENEEEESIETVIIDVQEISKEKNENKDIYMKDFTKKEQDIINESKKNL